MPSYGNVPNPIDIIALVRRGWFLFISDATKHIGFIVLVAFVPTLFVPEDVWSFVTVVIPIFEGAYLYALIRAKGDTPRFSDAFLIFNRALPLLLARWATLILVALGFVLFVIPGIYLSIAYLLVVPLILDRPLRVREALQLSRKTLSKQWFRVFGLMLVVLLINFIGMIPAGLGLIVTAPLTTCIVVALYDAVLGVRADIPYTE